MKVVEEKKKVRNRKSINRKYTPRKRKTKRGDSV